MGRLCERILIAQRALGTLKELAVLEKPSKVERDAAIQRFEYTFEASWKAVRQYMRDVEGLDVGSPKGVVRSSREIGLLEENEAVLALEMVDDRNLTVHTYNEPLADEIFNRIPQYVPLLEKWLGAIKGQ